MIIKLNQDWRIGGSLGSGGFAKVYLAQSDSGTPVVVKLIPKSPGAQRELLFEELHGVPNVIPILDRGEWNEHWALVMPKAEKSLRAYLSELGEPLCVDEAVQVITDIIEALAEVEGRIVHRDIKPDNVLLLDSHWCLADFGISRYAEATTAADTRKHAMTPQYAAPEQWRGDRATSATDVYSTGVLAYELLAGRRPFAGPDDHDYRRQHLEESPGQIPGIPIKLQSLIDECLYKAPEARPSPQNLLVRMKEGVWSSSGAGRRLQQANAIVVRQQAEAARQESIARSELERRAELHRVASESLQRITELMNEQILANAPLAARPSGHHFIGSWRLNDAVLSIDRSSMAEMASGNDNPSPFEVVSSSSIVLQIPRDESEYEGRGHSLWYCDAQEAGIFRWFETAFMPTAGLATFLPFVMEPGRSGYGAVLRTTANQVAWPFTPFDQGEEGDFIERWMQWFADAAQGELRRPSHMPERNPLGSWRRGT